MDIRDQINQLWSEYSRLEEIYRDFASSNGLSIPELGILHEAWVSGFTTQKQVTKLWSSPKQVVYNACRKLVSEGWIRMEKSDEDGRMQKLYLTEAGIQKAGPVVQDFSSLEASIFRAVGEEDCRQLIRLMKKMADTAAEIMKTKEVDLK